VPCLPADPEYPALDLEVGSPLDQIQAASVHYRIAFGPHAGRKALTLYRVPPLDAEPNNPHDALGRMPPAMYMRKLKLENSSLELST